MTGRASACMDGSGSPRNDGWARLTPEHGMNRDEIIDAAAARIDPEAFGDRVLAQAAMPLLRRRDEARRVAGEVLLVFEAARLGLVIDRHAA